jgi:hypothetical protein
MRHTYPSHDEMVFSLLEHFEASDGNGERWYRESRRFARSLQREHGGGLAKPAGVIAALSPQVQWAVNKRMAAHYMAHGEPGEGCLRLSEERAYRIWRGDKPLSVLRGPKTRAFYRAIMGDENAAVVDTWILAAVNWPSRGISPKQYERVAAALKDAARVTGLGTATFQAVVWVVVRGGAE